MFTLISLVPWLILIVVVVIFAYGVFRFRYKKAGPDEALIVYGRRKLIGKKVRDAKGDVEGFRIVRGGGTFVVPAWEQHVIDAEAEVCTAAGLAAPARFLPQMGGPPRGLASCGRSEDRSGGPSGGQFTQSGERDFL